MTPTVGNYGQKVRFIGGTGTVNTSTGASTIQWTGTFTINFYGSYTPFWIKNPKLEINASGQGSLTALVGGIKSDHTAPLCRSLPLSRPRKPHGPGVISPGSIRPSRQFPKNDHKGNRVVDLISSIDRSAVTL